MYDNHRPQDFFWGAVVGGAVATLTTLLFTTKKGKQIQQQIGTAYEEIEETIKSKASEAKEDLEDAAGNAYRKVTDKLKSGDHLSHAKEKLSEGKEKVEEMAENLHKKMASKHESHHKDSK